MTQSRAARLSQRAAARVDDDGDEVAPAVAHGTRGAAELLEVHEGEDPTEKVVRQVGQHRRHFRRLQGREVDDVGGVAQRRRQGGHVAAHGRRGARVRDDDCPGRYVRLRRGNFRLRRAACFSYRRRWGVQRRRQVSRSRSLLYLKLELVAQRDRCNEPRELRLRSARRSRLAAASRHSAALLLLRPPRQLKC